MHCHLALEREPCLPQPDWLREEEGRGAARGRGCCTGACAGGSRAGGDRFHTCLVDPREGWVEDWLVAQFLEGPFWAVSKAIFCN